MVRWPLPGLHWSVSPCSGDGWPLSLAGTLAAPCPQLGTWRSVESCCWSSRELPWALHSAPGPRVAHYERRQQGRCPPTWLFFGSHPCIVFQIVTSASTDLQDYTYYFVPAPWLSVKLLRLLQCYPPPGNSPLPPPWRAAGALPVTSQLLCGLEAVVGSKALPPRFPSED